MGNRCETITLYASQAQPVVDAIRRDGVCFSKEEYIRKKYGESAPIFLTAYQWFAYEAQAIVPKPEGAGLPYWAFADLYSLDRSGNSWVLTLEVPKDQVILFDLYDWNKIVCLHYIGENDREERDFHRELEQRGLRERDVMLSQFYPQWKEAIQDSWKRLFRHHEALLRGDTQGVGGVQAALWQIRQEWIREIRSPQEGEG